MGLFILDHYCDSYAHWIKLKLDSKSLLPIPQFSLVITVYDNSYYVKYYTNSIIIQLYTKAFI